MRVFTLFFGCLLFWQTGFGQSAVRSTNLTIHAVSGDVVNNSEAVDAFSTASLGEDLVQVLGFSPSGKAYSLSVNHRVLFSSIFDNAMVNGIEILDLRRSSTGFGGTSHSGLIQSSAGNGYAVFAEDWFSGMPYLVGQPGDQTILGPIASILEVSPNHGVGNSVFACMIQEESTGNLTRAICSDLGNEIGIVVLTGPSVIPVSGADGFSDIDTKPTISSNGTVHGFARMYGASINSTNDHCVFRAKNRFDLELVVREGLSIDNGIFGESVDYQVSESGTVAVSDNAGNLMRLSDNSRQLLPRGTTIGRATLVEMSGFDISNDGRLLGLATTNRGQALVRWETSGQVNSLILTGSSIALGDGQRGVVTSLFRPSISDLNSRYGAAMAIVRLRNGTSVTAILAIDANTIRPVLVSGDRVLFGSNPKIVWMDLASGRGTVSVRDGKVAIICGLTTGEQTVVTAPLSQN